WYPGVILTSGLVCAAWGYFLYMGTIDPLGGINSLWPLFGIANQMLAAIALCVATTILVKSGKLRYAWITLLPLSWLVTVTSTAAVEKLLSPEPRVGFLAHAEDLGAQLAAGSIHADTAAQLIFNDRLDAVLTVLFLAATWVLVCETLRVCLAIVTGRRHPPLTETPRLPNRLAPE
ncbi:MAG: carbon starvation protein A, partial [Beggiatoa sp.]|nr:carbon starvation protein A [Beggiatoa sp.]